MTDLHLENDVLDRVLAKLGFSRRPDPTPLSLKALYGAWCQKIPFDNLRKLIHIRSGNAGPLPGSGARDFFENWLQYGTGGTCWSGAGACHALLVTLGFDAARGIGTMMVAPDLPPNHGTVRVRFGPQEFLVDCSMLHGEPLPLAQDRETAIFHPAWGLRCVMKDGRWHIAWRPLHKLEGLECRLESFGASREDYETHYEQTRGWSPFNYELCIRRNRGDDVVGIGFGYKVVIRSSGQAEREPLSPGIRERLLIEELGISEEFVRRVPADVPTPPPPWSRTAEMAQAR